MSRYARTIRPKASVAGDSLPLSDPANAKRHAERPQCAPPPRKARTANIRTHGFLGRVVGLGLLVAVANVLGDEVLERLQALEELLGADGLLGLVGSDQPRRRFGRGLPADLLGFRAALLERLAVGAAGDRLDAIEVDVREAVALRLVVLDPRRAALGRLRCRADLGGTSCTRRRRRP